MLNTPFSPWPSYSAEEAKAVQDVVMSNRVNYWTGNECREFEKEFAQFSESTYAIALMNGTVALDLALLALDIGAGDEVIVTPRTFIASISSVVTIGATPVFADVDRNTQNLSVETMSAVLTPRTKAVVVVHLAGMPADMPAIMQFAEDNDLKIIEDCAQAHGARINGQSVGSFGHISAWSFCQDKIMTTGGEGGMVTTDDEVLWSKMWSYKDHGKSWDAVYNREHAPGFRWLHESFGTNFRMTEMQAVIGRIQLGRMKDWQQQRLDNAERIWATCRKMAWMRVPDVPDTYLHAAYKAYVFIRPEKLPTGWDRDRVLHALLDENIPVFSGSCSEVYLEKAFDGTGYRPAEALPVAKELGDTSIMFLVHPTLTAAEIDKTCQAIERVAVQLND